MSKKEARDQHLAHTSESLFGKENYTWMLIGIVVIGIGMLVMSGGKSSDPGVFDQK